MCFGAVRLRNVLATLRLELGLCFETTNAIISSAEDPSWREKPATVITLPSKPGIARLKSFGAVEMHSRTQSALRDPASDGRHSMSPIVALQHRIDGCLSRRLAVRALKEN